MKKLKIFKSFNFLSILFRMTILIFIFINCNQKVVTTNDPNLKLNNGRLVYNDELFTGKLKEELPVLNEYRVTEYKDGLEHGDFIIKKVTGELIERRQFINGIKHGVHEGWYPNGQRKFYSRFNMGNYIEERFVWHSNGNPFEYEKYNDNGKVIAYKKWRPDKQIYMNLSFSDDGSSTGLPGSKLCEPIKGKDENNK